MFREWTWTNFFLWNSLTTYQKILNKLQLRVILIKIDFRFVSCFFLVSKSKSRKPTGEGKRADGIQCCINHFIRLLCYCKTPNIPGYVLRLNAFVHRKSDKITSLHGYARISTQYIFALARQTDTRKMCVVELHQRHSFFCTVLKSHNAFSHFA